MGSWKKVSRARHKAAYRVWKDHDSNTKAQHYSRWASRRWGKQDIYYSWLEPWGLKYWRKRYWLRQRRDEQHVKDGLTKFAKFPYYEDCRYHVCKIVKIEANCPAAGRIDVEGESLINGTYSSCSYEHCGIIHLTKEDGEERIAFVKQMGMMPYQLKYVYGIPEDRDKLEESLRYSIGMDRDWNFNKNGGTQEITDAGKVWLLEVTGVVYDDLAPMEEEERLKALGE